MTSLSTYLLRHQVTPLPGDRRRRINTNGAPRRGTDHGPPTRPRPQRSHRHPLRDPLRWTSKPFLGARARPPGLQVPHPALLVRHPNATSTGKSPTPTDAHRRRATGIPTVTSPVFPRPQLHYGLPRPLAPSAPTYSFPGHTRDTKRATACGGCKRSPTALHRTPLTRSASSTTRDRSRLTSSLCATQVPGTQNHG